LKDLLPESGFCWKKGPSRHHVSEDQEIPEKYYKIIFRQKTEEARRGNERNNRVGSPTGGRAHP
jgi:hypothetical protein